MTDISLDKIQTIEYANSINQKYAVGIYGLNIHTNDSKIFITPKNEFEFTLLLQKLNKNIIFK